MHGEQGRCPGLRTRRSARQRADAGLHRAHSKGYQRDPQAIERWQRETYPGIALAARHSSAEIYLRDASGFQVDAVHGKTRAPKGETPVIERLGRQQSISAASAVNVKRGFWLSLRANQPISSSSPDAMLGVGANLSRYPRCIDRRLHVSIAAIAWPASIQSGI